MSSRRPADSPVPSGPLAGVVDIRPPSGRSRSRAGGVLILAVALLVGVIVPRLLATPLVSRASRAPLPEPPAVGSCLAWSDGVVATGSDTSGTPERPVTVPCDLPHRAEVAAAWRADDPLVEELSEWSGYLQRPPAGPDRSMGGVPDDLVAACWSASQAFITPGPISAHWYPVPPRVVPALLPAPADAGTGRWRWVVCVVVAGDDASWAGALHWPAARPAALSANCQPDGSADFARCDRPHRTEVLGWPDYGDAGGTADLATGCAAHAVMMTRRTDPTFGGRVRIGVVDQLPVPYRGALPLCVAALVGDGELVGSLIGIGDGALPLA